MARTLPSDVAALRVEQMNAARLQKAARRAADDPKQLARATRIVTAAVADEQLSLEEHVRLLVAQAPPLTAEQRDRIASLLRPGAA